MITGIYRSAMEDNDKRLICAHDDVRSLGAIIHEYNAKWWFDENGNRVQRNVGELLMLTVSELAEGMEGDRKRLMDDKLPHRSMLEVELADAIIRCLDMGEGLGLDVPGALVEKLAYNAVRHDHTYEARKAPGGKRY
jgi:hypothetical protein